MSFLCLRRGVSAYDANQGASRGFSLPTQRCFHGILKGVAHCFLFSAYAEVFPLTFSGTVTAAAFLCLRRGVSSLCRVVTRLARFSLPTQRCFLPSRSPARLPSTFLCLRRGVSLKRAGDADTASFSLPTQRCFLSATAQLQQHPLFSAYAEVFLHHWRPGLAQLTFLCLRRGVSRSGGPCVLTRCFSLPTQRCFLPGYVVPTRVFLFSAYAEVFRGLRMSTDGKCYQER